MSEVFMLFENFVNMCEDEKCCGKGEDDLENFQNRLKSADIIEKLCQKTYNEDFQDLFEEKLRLWMRLRKWKQEYALEFFREACDHVLKKYIPSVCTKEKINSMVEEYINVCGEHRLYAFAKKGILNNSSILITLDAFDKVNKKLEASCLPVIPVDFMLVIFSWSKHLKHNSNLKETILSFWNEMGGTKPVFEMMLLVTLLEIDEICSVQLCILEMFISKMKSEESVSEMWELFSSVSCDIVVRICEKYANFLTCYVQFLTLVGGKFSCRYSETEYKWVVAGSVGDRDDFEVLVNLVNCLLQGNDNVRLVMKETLQKLQNQSRFSFWEEVEEKCST